MVRTLVRSQCTEVDAESNEDVPVFIAQENTPKRDTSALSSIECSPMPPTRMCVQQGWPSTVISAEVLDAGFQ